MCCSLFTETQALADLAAQKVVVKYTDVEQPILSIQQGIAANSFNPMDIKPTVIGDPDGESAVVDTSTIIGDPDGESAVVDMSTIIGDPDGESAVVSHSKFKIIISSDKLKYGRTLATSQYTIIHNDISYILKLKEQMLMWLKNISE